MTETVAGASDPRERGLIDRIDAAAEELLEFIAGSVRVPSVTGDETLFGERVSAWLTDHGFETYTRHIDPALKDREGGFGAEVDLERRPNVFGWLRSPHSNGRPPLVISTHQDVVTPGDESSWSHDPWGGERLNGYIWGRGSTDMKASIGAALFALRAVANSDIEPMCDVELQCVVAEESGGLGTLSALDTEPTPAAAIVLEPSECVPCPACSGCVHFTVRLEGRAAHAATPWMGVSAIDKLVVVYQALAAEQARRRAGQSHPLFAHLPDGAPFSMGVFRAGEWRSSVAERAEMIGRFGVMPGESIDDGRASIERAVRDAAEADEWLREHPPIVSWDNAGFAAWETDTSEPVVITLAGAAAAVTGTQSLAGVTYGSDAGHFANRGVPVVIFGPGRITDAHARDETVEETQVIACAKALALTIARFGRSAPDGRA
jgi:acetylornithine deacetylase